MNDSYSVLGYNLNLGENADQLERLAINRTIASVNDAMLDEQAAGVQNDAAVADIVEQDTAATEELAGGTLEHIQERQRLLGDAYPFILNGQSLKYKPSQSGVYEFCLALSLDLSGASQRIPIVTFELLAGRLAAKFFGGEHYRTGWPSHNLDERPVRFRDLSDRIHEASGEWWWGPGPHDHSDPLPSEVKDEGMDFIAWRRLDKREGNLFIVGQCACGTDWRNKFNDLDAERLERWFKRTTCVPFTRALAIPYVVPGRDAIGEVSRYAGLVFDRIRLTLNAETGPAKERKALRQWIYRQKTTTLPRSPNIRKRANDSFE